MRGVRWTDERIDLLKRLWADGKTASGIAAALGDISRSAVLGKIFRLRLDISAGGESAEAQAKPRIHDRAGKSTRPMRHGAPSRRRRGAKQTSSPEKPRAAGRKTRKTLLELTNDCCRWPHGRPGKENFFFCGAPGADLEAGIPYCARHMQRAYLVPPAIVARARLVISRAA